MGFGKKGNNMSYSLTVDNYADEITDYKKKNNLDSFNYCEIFIFLTNLGISEKSFEEPLVFLIKYFKKDLKLKLRKNNFLLLYFK